MQIMKTKNRNFLRILLVTGLLFTCGQLKTYAQDTLKSSKSLTDAKLELLEYNQKILEAKLELLETTRSQSGFNSKRHTDARHYFVNTPNDKAAPDTLKIKPFTQAITFSMNRIFEGTLQLGYEKAIKKNLSLDVSLLGTYVTKDGFGRGYLSGQSFGYADEATNSYISYNGNMIRGIGGIVRLKNYLLTRVNADSKAPIGLYAAPQLMYRRLWITGNQYNHQKSRRFSGRCHSGEQVYRG